MEQRWHELQLSGHISLVCTELHDAFNAAENPEEGGGSSSDQNPGLMTMQFHDSSTHTAVNDASVLDTIDVLDRFA
jgi:hypothetical protein